MGPTPAKVGRVNAGLLWNSSHRSGLIPDPVATGLLLNDVEWRTIWVVWVTARSRWIWDQSLLTVEINTITRWVRKGSPNAN
jgi:hypothetical protein